MLLVRTDFPGKPSYRAFKVKPIMQYIPPLPPSLWQTFKHKTGLLKSCSDSLLPHCSSNNFNLIISEKGQNVPTSVPIQPHSWGMRQHLNSLKMYYTWEISYKIYTVMQTDAFPKLQLLMQLCTYSEVYT